MNGYHIFYQSKDVDDQFESINYLTQIASILFWKKNEGKISLYCNTKYLDFIKKWRIDLLYDEINTECLDNIPYKEYLHKYWSFCKIEAALDISKSHKNFVIIDTDLWIHEPLNFDTNHQFVGYHQEQSLIHPDNPYVNPDNYMSQSDMSLFNWDISPVNCAFLYLNSRTLIIEWYNLALKVIDDNKHVKIKDLSADIVFIEQRLLPTLVNKLEMSMSTLIPNVYIPHIKPDNNGCEWIPALGFDSENQYNISNIKHVWGLKKMYTDPNIRNLVIDTVVKSLDKHFFDWKPLAEKVLIEVDQF